MKLAAAIVAAVCLAGCGTSDEEQIRRAFRDFYAGAHRGDAKRACGAVAARYLAELLRAYDELSCPAYVERRTDEDDTEVADGLAGLPLGAFEIAEDRARALVTFPPRAKTEPMTVTFVRFANTWRYDGPAALTPEPEAKPVLWSEPPRVFPSARPAVRCAHPAG